MLEDSSSDTLLELPFHLIRTLANTTPRPQQEKKSFSSRKILRVLRTHLNHQRHPANPPAFTCVRWTGPNIELIEFFRD